MGAGVGVVNTGGELGEALVDQHPGGGGHGAGQSGLAGSPPIGTDLDVAVGVDAGTTSLDGVGIDVGDNRIDERSKPCRRQMITCRQCCGAAGVDLVDGVRAAQAGARHSDVEPLQIDTPRRQ
ncbi:Uncharacterised protein [Mycobacteroides abscessus subsp. abscessus]|nr:Uncharacterised protein [Mycobacteroides abscessus subsp. abscessus]